MNVQRLLLSAALGFTVFAANAGELYTPAQYDDQQKSTLTREQIKQDVVRAQVQGQLQHNDFAVPTPAATVQFARTRADVKAETLAAAHAGALAHNDVDLPAVAKGSVLTRQEVKAEAIASRQSVRLAPGKNTIDY